jgi:hypothetical protein
MRTETIPDGHRWWRIARHEWEDPLDPTFAREHGGRWNPPGSFPALYLNEDQVTARINVRSFITGWPYEPEDLRDDTGPLLIAALLPRRQRVADVHTPQGVRAVGLPAAYPLDHARQVVAHQHCHQVGVAAKNRGLRGIRCRSAQAPLGAGRELAWFPATTRSQARLIETLPFTDWFWR